jgi:hypothetical protein
LAERTVCGWGAAVGVSVGAIAVGVGGREVAVGVDVGNGWVGVAVGGGFVGVGAAVGTSVAGNVGDARNATVAASSAGGLAAGAALFPGHPASSSAAIDKTAMQPDLSSALCNIGFLFARSDGLARGRHS